MLHDVVRQPKNVARCCKKHQFVVWMASKIMIYVTIAMAK